MRRRPRKSPAEHKRAVNAQLAFLAAGSENPRAASLLGMRSEVRAYKPRKRSGRPRERDILVEILAALAKHPLVARVERRQSGLFRDGERWIRVGRKGDPDITGILHGGKAFGLEIKSPGKYPDENQWKAIYAIRNAGGLAGCAHDVDEAIAIISER